VLPREAIEDEPSLNALPSRFCRGEGDSPAFTNCRGRSGGMPEFALRFPSAAYVFFQDGLLEHQPYGLACLTGWARRCGCPPGCRSHCGSSFRLGLQIPRRIERA
jgi:hypothetical protein